MLKKDQRAEEKVSQVFFSTENWDQSWLTKLHV